MQGARSVDPLKEVLVTVGASQALALACNTLLDSGDEVVLIEPAFDIYSAAAVLAGAVPVYVPLRPVSDKPVKSSSQLHLDMDELAAALNSKTKMVILNSPHNPTGKVFTRDEYRAIADLLDKKCPDCIVLSGKIGHMPRSRVCGGPDPLCIQFSHHRVRLTPVRQQRSLTVAFQ